MIFQFWLSEVFTLVVQWRLPTMAALWLRAVKPFTAGILGFIVEAWAVPHAEGAVAGSPCLPASGLAYF